MDTRPTTRTPYYITLHTFTIQHRHQQFSRVEFALTLETPTTPHQLPGCGRRTRPRLVHVPGTQPWAQLTLQILLASGVHSHLVRSFHSRPQTRKPRPDTGKPAHKSRKGDAAKKTEENHTRFASPTPRPSWIARSRTPNELQVHFRVQVHFPLWSVWMWSSPRPFTALVR